LVHHCAFDGEVVLDVLSAVNVKGVSIELDGRVLLFFRFFDLELFFLRFLFWFFCLHLLLTFSRLSFLLFSLLLISLLFGNLSLLSPFFDQVTIFKANQSIFVISKFESDSEALLFRILRLCHIITDMLAKPIHEGFILDQNFDSFFSRELNGLACGHLASFFEDHLPLFFRIELRVQSEVLVSFNEVPVKLDSVVSFLIEAVLFDLEERTLDSCHQGASSRN